MRRLALLSTWRVASGFPAVIACCGRLTPKSLVETIGVTTAQVSDRGGQFCGSGGQMSFPRDAPACREYGAAIDARDAGDERKAC